MTDIYLNQINRRRSKTGCLVLSVAAAVIAAGGVAYYFWPEGSGEDPASTDAVPVTSTVAPSRRAPSPDTAAASRAERPVLRDDASASLLEQAVALRAEDRLLEARDLLWRIREESKDAGLIRAAEDQLGEIHTLMVFSRRAMPEKVEYVIKSGDSLERIANRHGTTIDLLRKSNEIRGDNIFAGHRMRIFTGEFRVEVNKTTNEMYLYHNNRFFKRYRVGTGEFGTTPVGTFKIVDRIVQPVWWRHGRAIPYGHPDNLLGTHYLKLDIPAYGLHGTWEPESVGFQSSAGCVRLLNEEIEELYTLLPVGVQVIITE